MSFNRTTISPWIGASLLGAAHTWSLGASAQSPPYQYGAIGAQRPGHSQGNVTQTAPYQYGSVAGVQRPGTAQGWSQVVARTTGRAGDLWVDGRVLCRLPCQIAVPSGVHVIVGRGPEGASAEQRLYFPAGTAVPVLIDIVPARALLRVSATVPGTLVYVDGALVGNTSWQGAIPAGRHTIELRRPTGERVFQELTVAAGMTYNLRDNAAVRTATPQAHSPVQNTAPTSTGRSGPKPAAPPIQQAYPPLQRTPEQQRSAFGAPSAGYAPDGAAPSTEPPTNDAGERDRYRGVTGAFMVPILLGGASTNDYVDHCPATAFGGYCSASGPRGAAILGRLGYAFDWIAPELTVGLALDLSSGGLHLPNDAKIEGDPDGLLTQIAGKTKFLRVGILGALGVRIASSGRNSRFALSGSLGLVKRHVYVLPDSFFGDKPSYVAKSLFFDAGILLGDTPGAKIHAGLFTWFEFVPSLVIERDVTKLGLTKDLVPASLRRVTPFSGTQIMFGPFIAVTFGH